MNTSKSNLWVNKDFIKLWIGQSVSQMGAQITLLALPLIAVQTLNATPVQMGTLRAAEFLPFLFFGLFAGVLCDRIGCRPILIVCDIARMLALLAIPIVAIQNDISIILLYATAFLVGVATVFFDVAYWSYLPSLVARDELIKGNSKLSLSQSMAEALGPGAAGLLVQLLTAPIAILLNAASFLISAISLIMIQHQTKPPVIVQDNVKISKKLIRGLVFVFENATLRALMLRATLWNFLYNLVMPVFLLYCIQTLALNAIYVGMLFTAIGLGLVIGAMLVDTVLFKYSVARLINISMLVAAICVFGISIKLNHHIPQMVLLMVSLFIIGVTNSIYNISNVSLRQALTPTELLGQMTAAMRFVSWGTIPLGALLGGILAEHIGYLPTIMCAGSLGLLTALMGLFRGTLNDLVEQNSPEAL